MSCLNVKDNEFSLLINRLCEEINKLKNDTNAKFLVTDGKIAECCTYIKDNLSNELRTLVDVMASTGEIDEIIKSMITNEYTYSIDVLKDLFVTPEMFGCICDGINDDTKSIQDAIDYANTKNRVVYLSNKTYLISKPLILNGCSLIGSVSNIYNETGTIIKCKTNDFIAIKQGSTSTNDIKFNIKDIMVVNSDTGFELVYVINSKFENLYVKNSNVGFKLGNINSVGSMFNEFNNLYTSNCKTGIVIESKEYFNNNVFNNGFIDGELDSLTMSVNGGYGAVNNTFNNVEFRSRGRGVTLTSTINTTFNNCYFESNGNAIRLINYSSIILNNCIYGLFNKSNKYNDINMIYTNGGGAITINNGVVFLTTENDNTYFFGANNDDVYQNINVIKSIVRNGNANNFNFFKEKVNTYALTKEEQVVTTGTVTAVKEGFTQISFTYNDEFSSIPNVVTPTLRGANNIANGLTYVVSERTKTGGVISVYNSSTSDKSISFSIYAKLI